MEIYEIKNLDCSKKKNRISLVKSTMKAMTLEEKPTAKELEKFCKKICKKYDIPIKRFEQSNNVLFVSLEVESGSYSTFICVSYYEMLCKYILFVRAILKNRKLKVK